MDTENIQKIRPDVKLQATPTSLHEYIDLTDTSEPVLNDAERVNLHALVSEATEAIAPN